MIDLKGLNGSKSLNALLLPVHFFDRHILIRQFAAISYEYDLKTEEGMSSMDDVEVSVFQGNFRCQRGSITYPAINKFCGWEKEGSPPLHI